MINLIPPTAKNKLIHDYFLRFTSLIFIVAAVACLVLFFLSIPTWVMLKHQLGSISDNKEFISGVESEHKILDEEGREIEEIIQHVDRQKPPRSRAEVIVLIDELSGDGVVVDRFVFGDKNKLTISGVASTRPELSDFRDRLTEQKIFSSVELPLSSLVNERDANFNITMVVK
ncbi:MAG: PilN domain-containing protein [Candidatus Paceibacterota bacterium]